MSLVLYRKYRPKSLKDVVAQTSVVKTLEAALKKQTLGHALLFTGPRGVGKTSLARIIAHEINQADYNLDETPLDIIEIDAASNRRIDEIRDLKENVKFLPIQLKYKVYIIDEVHMLTKEAFNALLKTLEEPPEHIIFILATTEVHKVPATIISRCQHFSFSNIDEQALSKRLEYIAQEENIKIDQKALSLISHYAQGGLRDGLSLLEQIASLNKPINAKLVEEILGLSPAQQLNALIKALLDSKLSETMNIYQSLIDKGVNSMVLVNQLMYELRNVLKGEKNIEISKKILNILEDLLNVINSKQPQISLEIILLKHSCPKD